MAFSQNTLTLFTTWGVAPGYDDAGLRPKKATLYSNVSEIVAKLKATYKNREELQEKQDGIYVITRPYPS